MFAVCALSSASVMGQCAVPTFRSAINVHAGPTPPDIASGDLNADGRTDLVVPNPGTNEAYVFLGTSSGVPTTTKLTSVNNPTNAGIGDFNRDGKLDLAITHGEFSTAGISILIGNGSGGFGAPTNFPTNTWKYLVVADFNNDGNADVFIGNDNAAQVLLGNGSGGLGGGSTVNLFSSIGAVPGDFNKDNKLNVALVSDGLDFVSLIVGDGLGNFSAPKTFPVSHGARSLATGDFNNDTKLDLVTAGHVDGFSILLGDGAGNFGAATSVNLGFPSATVTTADFSGDGKPDVAVSGDQSKLALIVGNGNG